MPGLNGRGPEGKGSGTGRGLGKCNSRKEGSETVANNEDQPMGRALRQGRGRGKGLRNGNEAGRGSGRRTGRRDA